MPCQNDRAFYIIAIIQIYEITPYSSFELAKSMGASFENLIIYLNQQQNFWNEKVVW